MQAQLNLYIKKTEKIKKLCDNFSSKNYKKDRKFTVVSNNYNESTTEAFDFVNVNVYNSESISLNCTTNPNLIADDYLLNENLNSIDFSVKQILNENKNFYLKNLNKITFLKNKIDNNSFTNDNNNLQEFIFFNVPRLIPEDLVDKCFGCRKLFGCCKWKYNCRCCGNVFFFNCSWNKETFLPFYSLPVRICDNCYELKKYKSEA